MPPRDTLADSLVYVSHGTAAEGPRKADHEESGARTGRIHGRRRAPGTPALSLIFFFFFFADTTHPQEGHDAPERRCSSRTFRYGYLVTT